MPVEHKIFVSDRRTQSQNYGKAPRLKVVNEKTPTIPEVDSKEEDEASRDTNIRRFSKNVRPRTESNASVSNVAKKADNFKNESSYDNPAYTGSVSGDSSKTSRSSIVNGGFVRGSNVGESLRSNQQSEGSLE